MPVYATADEFYRVMKALLERLAADPTAVEQFQRSRMAIRFRCTESEAELLLDGRQGPVEVYVGPQPEPRPVDLELLLPADLLHDIWLGRVRLRDAFRDGRLQTRGNVFRALQLAGLFRRAEALYPLILEELGYGELLG